MLIKHLDYVFDEAIATVNKKLSAAGVECVALRWNRDEVLSKLKVVDTDLEDSLKAVFERITDGSSMMSKQLETKVARGLGWIFAEFNHDAAIFSGELTTSLLEISSGALCGAANSVELFFSTLATVRENNFVKLSS